MGANESRNQCFNDSCIYAPVNDDNGRIRDEFLGKMCNMLNEGNPEGGKYSC